MKIEVDRNLCDGNGVCMGIAPDIFDVDDDLYLHIAEDIEDTPENRVLVKEAVATCPVLALRVDWDA